MSNSCTPSLWPTTRNRHCHFCIFDMHGAGWVRSLREAASLDNALANELLALEADSRGAMLQRLDAGFSAFKHNLWRVAA